MKLDGMKLENKRTIAFILIAIAIILLVGAFSYAYFTTAGRQDPVSGGFTTATMSLKFSDNDNGLDVKLSLGETATKKFTIENTGTVEASMSIDWVDLVNTYTNGSLTYRLTMSETEDGEYKEVIPKTNVPVSSTPIKRMMDSEISVPAGETYYYNLEVTFNNLDEDQSSDINAVFHSYFGAGQISRYRYYKLSVNPNGGVWDEFSSTQEYLLKNGETKTINTPSRVGHTFEGWTLNGVSSTLEDGLFKMGISDASLEARWIPNKYKVTIDGVEREVEYGSSIDLGTPSKEGYTFTNWESTGGTIENNTLTVTDAKDIVVTSKYVINNYKYIVYHNKMNINGVGYTRVEADTDEGESEYNSTVTPEVKIYTGFDSPSQGSITIKHETVYPPVLNKVEYNYDRHQHTLTIEPDGGTYTGQTTSTMYYEATVTLTPPTKTGYNFTNWTASTGTINGNEFTMGDEDSTITANYEAKSFSVTFNANGGTTPTASKTVTYDSNYGELPTPTYDGYEFLGWFTSQEDGTQILSTTKVALSNNQTLFAHWKKKGIPINTLLFGKANDLSITDYNSGNKKEMYVFTHDELTTTIEDPIGNPHSLTATQVMDWSSEERKDYRYIGNEPNNYITFNDETWRIIGIFTVEIENANKQQLVKIVRNESIGTLPWDSNNTIEWSTASLQTLLNGDYYNQSGNYASTSSIKGLNSLARSQIAKVKWYLGGTNSLHMDEMWAEYFNALNFYSIERGIDVKDGNSINIIQNVGLMYLSDFMFAQGQEGWLCSSEREYQWSLSIGDSVTNGVFTAERCYPYYTTIDSSMGTYPSVYLNSSVEIIEGDGSQGNLYQIK